MQTENVELRFKVENAVSQQTLNLKEYIFKRNKGVAEFGRFAQIRFQSIIRFPDCNRQRPHLQLQIGTQSTKYNFKILWVN